MLCPIASQALDCALPKRYDTVQRSADLARIYLDHSATTPVRPEVLEAMLPFLRDVHGNAGSIHSFGREARRAVDDARDQVAALINADPREIVFTSGGTESDNLAIRGVLAADKRERRRIVASAVEHHAVLHAAEYVRKHDGIEVVVIPVDSEGLVDADEVAAAINDDTVLVSIMHGNNETGTIQPVEQIAAICAERGVVFHSDTVQSIGKVPVDVMQWPVGMLAISGHKLYAPKGVGACYVRNGVRIEPQAVGGAQERQRRAGTENVPGIVALGKACEFARAEMAETSARIARLRDVLEQGILAKVPGVCINGSRELRLPHILNVGFPGVDGESLLLALDVEGIAVSSGAACTAGSLDPSHVLLAMGIPHDLAQSAIRFSLGRSTTRQEIDEVTNILPKVVKRIAGKSPLSSSD